MHFHFIHFVDICVVSTLGLFYSDQADMNFAAGLCVVFVFSSLGKTYSGIARTYGKFMFNIKKKNCQTVFQSGLTILQFHQEYTRSSSFSTSPPTLVIIRLLIVAILASVK